ncbi:MAG: peptidylprolyl isomerase [Clostridia bacterium]|nr:peptidylprolyl isomerase [Clostridia bacterium]
MKKHMFAAFLIVALLLASLVSCQDSTPKTDNLYSLEEHYTPSEEITDYVCINVSYTDKNGEKKVSNIVVKLSPEDAPITVENFKTLVSEGFYTGLTFHRIIKNFMIQGGDPKGDGTGGSPNKIKGEFSANGVANDISHIRGVISMARRGDSMDSASSQFFIVHKDSTYLDGDYAAFGHVTFGIEVVDAIASVSTNSSDAPLNKVTINTITFVTPK